MECLVMKEGCRGGHGVKSLCTAKSESINLIAEETAELRKELIKNFEIDGA